MRARVCVAEAAKRREAADSVSCLHISLVMAIVSEREKVFGHGHSE